MTDKNYLKEAWLVLTLSFLFGATLAAVQIVLNPRIEDNKLQDTLGQIPTLVPGAVGGEMRTMGDQRIYEARNANGETVGWVIQAAGQGFADRVELLIGVDRNVRRVTGLYILDQKETPGLGNKVTEEVWREQFRNRFADRPLKVVKTRPTSEEEIQGVTGATISSESVVGIINAAVAQFRAGLGEGGSL